MTAPRRLLVINPNADRTVTGWLAGEARRVAGPGVVVEAVNAASGLAAIETPADIARAAAAVVAAARGHPAAEGFVIGAFGDPGLAVLRAAGLGPVAGLGLSGLQAAGRENRLFAIVTLGAAMDLPIRARIAGLGLAARLVALTVLPVSIAAFVAAREAHSALQEAALKMAVRACIDTHGAEAVLLGGAPFAGLARDLAQCCGRPVLDGVAESLADLARDSDASG